MGTDTPGHPSAIGTDSHSKPAQLASEECSELQPRDWQPGLAWQAPDVRDFAPAAQAGAASAGHPPNSPCYQLQKQSSLSWHFRVSLPHSTAAGAAQGAEPCVSVLAPGSPGGTTPGWDQAHVVARSTVPNAPLATPRDVDLPADDASEASDASAATANSSNFDPQSPDEVPVISPPDLAAVLAALLPHAQMPSSEPGW